MGVLTEYIFSHAVALHQSGRLKNNIYVHQRDVYILNADHTLLIQFQLPPKEPTFKNPIGFAANDYDSDEFEEKDGKIIFTQKTDRLIRTKTCAAADGTFADADTIFKSLWSDFFGIRAEVAFNKDELSFLEDNLSHVEFKGEDGEWILTQRDIYTGNIIEIQENQVGLLKGDIPDFGPIGIRTNDFKALFQFNEDVTFWFFPEVDAQYCFFLGSKFNMRGILAGCIYDEMGTIQNIKEKPNGRKKPKNRTSQPKADTTINKRKRRRRN